MNNDMGSLLKNDDDNATMTSATSANAPRARNEALATAEVAIQCVIFFLAVVGNMAVLVMLRCMSRDKTLSRMYTMIGHLSCADLFVAIFNLLPQIIWDVTFRFQGGRLACKLIKYGQVVAMYASAYVLVSTAIDRYIAICHPMRSHSWSSTTAHYMVAGAWLVAFIFAIPQVIIFDYVEQPTGSNVYDCLDNFEPSWTLKLYITWFALAIYIVPLIFLAAIYTEICLVVWRSSSTTPNQPPPPPVPPSLSIPPSGRFEPQQTSSPCLFISDATNVHDSCKDLNSFHASTHPLVGPSSEVPCHSDFQCILSPSTLQGATDDEMQGAFTIYPMIPSPPPTVEKNKTEEGLGDEGVRGRGGGGRGGGSGGSEGGGGTGLGGEEAGGAGGTTVTALRRSFRRREALRKADSMDSTGPPSPAVVGPSRARTKTVKLTLTVVVTYLFCWGPFFFAQLWSAWDPSAPWEHTAMVITLLLASLNSCTNPWIYLAFSDHLRRRLTRSRCRRGGRGGGRGAGGGGREQGERRPTTSSGRYSRSSSGLAGLSGSQRRTIITGTPRIPSYDSTTIGR